MHLGMVLCAVLQAVPSQEYAHMLKLQLEQRYESSGGGQVSLFFSCSYVCVCVWVNFQDSPPPPLAHSLPPLPASRGFRSNTRFRLAITAGGLDFEDPSPSARFWAKNLGTRKASLVLIPRRPDPSCGEGAAAAYVA